MGYRDENEALRARNAALENELAALRVRDADSLEKRVSELESRLAETQAREDVAAHDHARAWAIDAYAAKKETASKRYFVGTFLLIATCLLAMAWSRILGIFVMLPMWIGVALWARSAVRCPFCRRPASSALQTRRRLRCEGCGTLVYRLAA